MGPQKLQLKSKFTRDIRSLVNSPISATDELKGLSLREYVDR